ncbi:TPA: hypothetical protein RQN12_001964 [Aeromonas dhakensis]|nr:hypothetical protein [Aeromonas dhakensis]
MLKPISQPFCGGALNACLELQMHLLRWLCNPLSTAADVTQGNLVPPIVPTQIEANWLWRFLHGRKQTRLDQAKLIATMASDEKQALLDWANRVVALANQFQPTPLPWPTVLPAISDASWTAFKNLMEAFYERGLKSGLPYTPDGTPVAAGGVCYANYVKAFREAHRLNPDPDAQEVCVLCGGPLGQTPEVDHWIAKSAFPLLSVCADNLLPICGECNSTANKGEKDVHTAGSFSDWFHPYLRPGNGGIRINYVMPEREAHCVATEIADQPKADHLDQLLNLSVRWTRKFKAEYLAKQKELFNLKQRGRGPSDLASLQSYLTDYQIAMDETGPHYEVGQAVAAAILEPDCLKAWHSELGLAT